MPKVADYIEQHREQIVSCYAEEVSKLPFEKGLTYYEIIDTLHEYLESLVCISRLGKRENTEQRAHRLEEVHINLRIRQGSRQDEVAAEYVLIGRLITGLWGQKSGAEHPSPDDLRLLTDELQMAMGHVVRVFSGYSVEERQMEKRYLRQLDTLSTDLMGETSVELAASDRLRPLLEIVQEAMDADGAALFLADESAQQLLPAGTVGLAAESAEAISLAEPSFLKQVAEADEAVYQPDASDAAQRVREPLRRSGLRSLLGLRLYPWS